MILISSINNDHSTREVAEWLLYNNIKFDILTEINTVTSINYKLSGKQIILNLANGKEVDFNKVKSFWYRNGNFFYNKGEYEEIFHRDEWKPLLQNMEDENKTLNELFYAIIEQKKSLSSYFTRNVNKLNVLRAAQKHGLKIPETYIVSNKKLIAQLFRRKKVINKNLSEIIQFATKDIELKNRTTEVDYKTLNDAFYPSLFQEMLVKKYEIRSVFFQKKFYSMAIFSQKDEKTQLDFRDYNYQKPNRVTPFILPQKQTIMLSNLMKELKLDFASIDMIVTQSDDFVFLEVNPVGQFGMVSKPCNYYLEKLIAKHLSQS